MFLRMLGEHPSGVGRALRSAHRVRASTSICRARSHTSPPSASCMCCQDPWSGSPCSPASCPAQRPSRRTAARPRRRSSARRSSAAHGSSGLQPLRWPSRFPFDSELAMLRRHLRKVHRPRGPLRAGRLPSGVRRRAAPRGSGYRADRRRRLRDAPGRGAQGGRADVSPRAADAPQRSRPPGSE